MKEQIIKDLMEAVHDIAKIKGENEALRNENKFLRELLTKQLNILPVSGCRQGDLCIICGEEIDSDYGSVCSDCDDSHLDD
jgi:hypothetical protein